jgi:hypothetical protein
MLSFNSLGRSGRLGNQMFQYAALRGIASKHGYSYSIPYSVFLNPWTDHQLNTCFRLNKNIIYGTQNVQTISELSFNFDKSLFYNCLDNTDLNGYFQTEKYFSHIKDEIVKDFTFKVDFEKPFDEYVAIHVRRGDYVNQPNFHPVCSKEYYLEALKLIPKKIPLVVFSDDIEWCKENIDADLYMENTTNVQDLYLMTKATHNIIANSSFSWWGAWLNQNPDKIVVSPKVWFGPAYSHYIMDDIRPPEWIQL